MNTILVPVDFSDVTERVISTARTYAQALGARVVLLHVVDPEPEFVGFEPGPITVRAAVAHDLRAEHHRLEELKRRNETPEVEMSALQIQGPIIAKILEQAAEKNAELIVVGSHGHGALYHLLVGSVTAGVLKGATCPVLIVPSGRS
jgi:nucleotide-binding universal stress UspA family protein